MICLQIPKTFLNKWKNGHNVIDVRPTEVHTAEPLVPDLTRLEVEIAIAKLNKYKSLSSDQIAAELIQTRGEILLSTIHKLINYTWNIYVPQTH
jgi:hypothetical protein